MTRLYLAHRRRRRLRCKCHNCIWRCLLGDLLFLLLLRLFFLIAVMNGDGQEWVWLLLLLLQRLRCRNLRPLQSASKYLVSLIAAIFTGNQVDLMAPTSSPASPPASAAAVASTLAEVIVIISLHSTFLYFPFFLQIAANVSNLIFFLPLSYFNCLLSSITLLYPHYCKRIAF